MKKSLFTLLIGSVFLLSGCEDKINTQKLLDAEKQIMHLSTQLKSAQAELEKSKNVFPSLNVEIVELFNKSEDVKLSKEQKAEFERESSAVQVFASIPKTNVAWLDQLLLAKVFSTLGVGLTQLKAEEITKDELTQILQQRYDTLMSDIKEQPAVAMSSSLESYYLGQRNNIVSFYFFSYDYYGGAHGMFMTHYANVDINKKKVITLNDLIDPRNQDKVKDALWEIYSIERLDENGEYNGFIAKNDFRISENFYFGLNSIRFVYPVYELGPYSEGEVEIELDWSMANKLFNSDYHRTAKDGFGQNPIEN